MKHWGILSLIILVGLASIIGGCSWVSKLTSSSLLPEQALPQSKTNAATIDFYAINWDDFPEERRLYVQELSKVIEEKITQWLGHRIRVTRFEILAGSSVPHRERPLASFPFKPSNTYKTVISAMVTKAMRSKANYLVARLRADTTDPQAICQLVAKIDKSSNSDYYLYIDTKGNKALLKEVHKIIKSCGGEKK